MMQLKESPSDLDLVLSSFSPMSSIDADRELHKSFQRTTEEARIKLLKCMFGHL